MKKDMIMEKYPWMITINDHVGVNSRYKENHDVNLLNVMAMAAKNSLELNSSKCKIKWHSITFYASTFTDTGIKLACTKIQGIIHMPASNDITMLQSFLGMCNFIQPFIPHVSHCTAPHWELSCKNGTPSIEISQSTEASRQSKPSFEDQWPTLTDRNPLKYKQMPTQKASEHVYPRNVSQWPSHWGVS